MGTAEALSPPGNGNGVIQITWGTTGSQTFNYTGAVQMFTVPNGVYNIKVQAIGANGGNAGGINGGTGASVSGIIAEFPLTQLYVYVGGRGQDGFAVCQGANGTSIADGGFNGGGNSPGTYYTTFDGFRGGGGGGASDVQALPASSANGSNNDWLIGAGGGGGAGGPGENGCTQDSLGGAGGAAGANGLNGNGPTGPTGQFFGGQFGCAPLMAACSTQNGGGAGGGGGSAASPGCVGGTTYTYIGGAGGCHGELAPYVGGYGGGGGGGYWGGGGGGGGAADDGGAQINPAGDGGGGGGAGGASYVPSSPLRIAVSLTPDTVDVCSTSTCPTPVTAMATITDAGQPVAGENVSFASSDPNVKIGSVTDHGDGTYTASLQPSGDPGDVTITASDDSENPAVTGTATLQQVCGSSTAALSGLSAPLSGEVRAFALAASAAPCPTPKPFNQMKAKAKLAEQKYSDDYELWSQQYNVLNCASHGGRMMGGRLLNIGQCLQIIYLRDQAMELRDQQAKIVSDPPDPAYTTVAKPRPKHKKPIAGRAFIAANRLIGDLEQINAIETAIEISKNRESAAKQAGATAAVSLQRSAMVTYAGRVVAITHKIKSLARAAFAPLRAIRLRSGRLISVPYHGLLAADRYLAAAMKALIASPP